MLKKLLVLTCGLGFAVAACGDDDVQDMLNEYDKNVASLCDSVNGECDGYIGEDGWYDGGTFCSDLDHELSAAKTHAYSGGKDEACARAMHGFVKCLDRLSSCDELDEWADVDSFHYPCFGAEERLESTCEGLSWWDRL